jgi:predicted nucleic acid-binding protein
MTFADLPAGAALFIDANTLVYHFVPHPLFGPACRQLVERVARQELVAYTSTHVLSDVGHRVMTMEAITRFGWPVASIAQRLRRHPAQIQALTRFRQAIDEVPHFAIQVLSIAPPLVSAAAVVSQQFGLLSGDALIVAIMQDRGLTALASHDADFDRVPGLSRYAPA